MKNLHDVINPYARQVVHIGSCFNRTESFSRHLPQFINVQNVEKKSHTHVKLPLSPLLLH
jgi:hypothetical protein